MTVNKNRRENKSFPSQFIKTIQLCGIERQRIISQGNFYVEKNKILSFRFPLGVATKAKETKRGIKAEIIFKKGVKFKEPFFFCFGLLGRQAEQKIVPNIILEDGAQVKIVAHCSFPQARDIHHQMKALFQLGEKANLFYEEYHYHGNFFGANVYPALRVKVGKASKFVSNFILTKGTVGKTRLEVAVDLEEKAKTEINTKVLGKGQKDRVEIFDKVVLRGRRSRSLIKMRAAAKNGGSVFMQGETVAYAAGTAGHVDCQEIVIGEKSQAKAVPIVEVFHPEARVTHEASVGKINQKELEALMARGLTESEATDLIVGAMMRR